MKPGEEHPKFLGRLDKSQDAVLVIAKWLTRQGYWVLVPPHKKAPNYAERWKYRDKGDAFIATPLKFEPQIPEIKTERLFDLRRIDVKGLTCDFTGRDDWPHRDRFFVCSRSSLDESDPQPERLFYVNRAFTHFGVLDPKKRDGWIVEKIKDSHFPGELPQPTYIANTDQVVFHALSEEQEATR